eukprot:SAG31_NODE_2844_length_5009_cov_2.067006_1_plen_151_part_00
MISGVRGTAIRDGAGSSGECESEFGRAALAALEGRDQCFARTVAEIAKARGDDTAQLAAKAELADAAVAKYKVWLESELPHMRVGRAAVGREGMEDLLANVCLVNWYTIEQLLDHADSELQRAQVVLERCLCFLYSIDFVYIYFALLVDG